MCFISHFTILFITPVFLIKHPLESCQNQSITSDFKFESYKTLCPYFIHKLVHGCLLF